MSSSTAGSLPSTLHLLEVPVSPFAPFKRRDPWWESDGPAARREHRQRRLRASLAFAAAMAAVVAAAFAWSIELGLAATVGIHASLPFG
jgi:hypothetical protein